MPTCCLSGLTPEQMTEERQEDEMAWLKYAAEPIVLDRLRTYRQREALSAYTKPCGFWITDDSEDCWRSWCTGERWGLERLTHKHEIDLDEDRILVLNSEWEVTAFARQYNVDNWWGPAGEPRKWRDRCIDWPRLAGDYAGIIITPYIWALRLADDYSWYYGWDCASGCIWDASAIKDVRLVEVDPGIVERYKRQDEAA